MPTIQKPQLDHVSFPSHEQSDLFHRELEAQRANILEQSGLNREFGNPGSAPKIGYEQEAAAFILELSGVISQAATIKMDAGSKPINKVIATLKSVKKNPARVLTGGVEPEALAMVASNYQRGEEEPGTFWFDVDRPDDELPHPNPQRVSHAASVAIQNLQALVRVGRPPDAMLDFLGARLLLCYGRFNESAGRRSIAADGEGTQAESGPLLEFFDLVIAPLNRFLIQLPPSYGAKAISGSELARRALRTPAKKLFERLG